ncbi:MAG: dihydroneopterin aldolase [bacterium]
MDRIIVSDLLTRCIIGVDKEERREKQEVVINLTISADLTKACKSDRFEDALDYRALKKEILAMVEKSQFRLIEALAEAIAAVCLKNEMVQGATVRVDKPGALRFARSVAVEITRTKQDLR